MGDDYTDNTPSPFYPFGVGLLIGMASGICVGLLLGVAVAGRLTG